MSYLGDVPVNALVDFYFNTRTPAGAPITFAGTPALRVYKDNGTAEITSGITLDVDFDGVTGLHHVRIDTGVSAGATYTAGSDYTVVVQAGTVNGQSVAGEKLASFSVQNRSALRPTVAGRTLDVSAGGEAGLDWANIGGPTTTVNLSGTTVKTATDVETDTQDLQGRLPAALVSGRIDASVGAMAAGVVTPAAVATGAIDADALAADAVAEIAAGISVPTAAAVADAVWDEAIADHLTAGSTGQKLNAAGGASDPLTNIVPGSYASGTAGHALGRVSSGQIVAVSAVAQNGDATIVRGDDYNAADGTALEWTDAEDAWPTLTGATIKVTLRDRFSDSATAASPYTGSVVTGTGTGKKVRLELTSAQTKVLTVGNPAYTFDVEATLSSGRIVTLVLGKVVVKKDPTVNP